MERLGSPARGYALEVLIAAVAVSFIDGQLLRVRLPLSGQPR